MCFFRLGLLVLLVSGAGCGSKTDPTENKPADSKPPAPATKLTLDNLNRIQIGMSTLTDAQQIFGGQGEATNEEKPGLGMGGKMVWKDGPRKVYVSFGYDGKANGRTWEGFDGR
jgi:hypothetical protein